MLNTLHNTDNGTIVYFNSERNNESAHDMLAQAESVTLADNGNYSGTIGDKVFRLIFTEKFIVLSYSNIIK